MPYIKPNARDWYEPEVSVLINLFQRGNPGHLNYLITRLVLGWLPTCSKYDDYNAVIGVLESVKLELYRRAVASYEDDKADENGDVF